VSQSPRYSTLPVTPAHAITGGNEETMHDIRIIRDDPDSFAKGLARRGVADAAIVTAELVTMDKDLRALLTRLQEAQARRNEASKLIGRAKAQKNDAEANALMSEVAGLKDEIQAGEESERALQAALRDRLAQLPNLPAADVPDGADEAANVEVPSRRWSKPPGSNAPKEHFEIGEALGMMDFERAVKVSGSRFVYLKGQLARLERALGAFMLDLHTGQFGYTEVSPPLMVRDDAAFGTGQLPKFAEDLFHTTNGFWLIPTAEVSLTNYVREEILDEAQLPIRFTAGTPCFRAEAGAAGRDTRGMIRMHQFTKVELVSITTPEDSESEHERMTDCAQEVLKRLDIAHRVVTLCTGDMGFTAKKTYDIEVWLPGQNRFREISSCSNCGDFQARRMNTRYRASAEKSTRFVHTLNGSGLAVGRTLVAILENYQDADGSVRVPEALVPYMGGMTKIEKAV
jgi:seryl-tRNA synthetase